MVTYTTPFCPRNTLRIPPKNSQLKTGAGVGVVTVLYCDVIPWLPPMDPRGETSLSPLYYCRAGQKNKKSYLENGLVMITVGFNLRVDIIAVVLKNPYVDHY